MIQDPFSGDPKLILGPGGATLQFSGGQPLMDQGIENQALLALFTDSSWIGNMILPAANQTGSKFESQVQGQALTLTGLSKIQDMATKALASPVFPELSVAVTNPVSDRVRLVVTAGPGQAPLSLQKYGPNWQAQATTPASGKVSVST